MFCIAFHSGTDLLSKPSSICTCTRQTYEAAIAGRCEVELFPSFACFQLLPQFSSLSSLLLSPIFTSVFRDNSMEANIAYTHPSVTKMDRLSTILHDLRRRDNIREFIDGLEDSECWPYPNDEYHSIPAAPTCSYCDEPCFEEADLRADKVKELTHLYITDVLRYHPLAPMNRRNKHHAELTDVCLEMCPEEGPGAYAVSYEVIDKVDRVAAPKLDLHNVATIRSAFMHRYEWVVNKVHTVNDDRLEAWKRAKAGMEHIASSDEEQNKAALSEEEDRDVFLSDDACVGAYQPT